jgi:prepilin-type N-terminal cleavage/methylation domain-containing protein
MTHLNNKNAVTARSGWTRGPVLFTILKGGCLMFHKSRKEKGFTLVEVIVVAVIVAVLAAVAIPLYMGYIRDSRINVCNNIAGTVASACGATRQQDTTIAIPSGGAGPLDLTFNGMNSVNNVIHIPDDYTVTITSGAGTVLVNHTSGGTSRTFTYK